MNVFSGGYRSFVNFFYCKYSVASADAVGSESTKVLL